jgi:hypothetical protein
MDRYGRNGGGGGGTPYIMPVFEDGFSYGPGDPVYQRIASIMSPQQWNALTDGQRQTIIGTAETAVENANKQAFVGRNAFYAQVPKRTTIGTGIHNAMTDMALNDLAAGQEQNNPLAGLFGGNAPSPPFADALRRLLGGSTP